jgi:2-keto-3-deoxy-L-rhamnonate aldolase RhmA
MKGNTLKGKLAQGQATIGTWITSYDPAVAEIVANLGFHWAIIDSEHAPMSLSCRTAF